MKRSNTPRLGVTQGGVNFATLATPHPRALLPRRARIQIVLARGNTHLAPALPELRARAAWVLRSLHLAL